MAVLDLGYNYFGDDPNQDPTFIEDRWGLPVGYGGVTEQGVNDYYGQVTPQTPDYGSFDMDPFYYASNGGWVPQDENGFDYPQDQYLDWYYNNPDAQGYIDDWWAGGDGNLDPGTPPATEPPPVPGGDGGSLPPYDGGTGGGNLPPSAPNSDWSTGYAPYGPGWPSISNPDKIEQYAEQNRMQAGAWGDLLDQTLRDYQNTYQNYEGNYRDWALNGPGGYGSILNGEAGFNDAEAANILQEQMLRGGMAGDAEYNANYLTPEERAAMSGDPYAARDMAAGKLAVVDDWMRQGTAAQRNAISALDTELRATVDPTKLGLSDEYKANFQFGQGDADPMADQAGRIAGTNALAREMQLRDAAFAHGNTSPIALEAARGRTGVYGDMAAADAVTDARLKGKGLMLDVARNREQDRLNAERDISSRQRQNVSETRQTQYGMEKDNLESWKDWGKYNTGLMVDTTGQAEANAAQRAGQIATNRQNANQSNIATRFGQAGTASAALGARYGQVYGQKKAEQQEGRNFLTGQQDRAQAGAASTLGQRANLYGTRLGGLNTATGLVINAKSLPTALDKGLGFVSGVIGG